MRGSEQWIIKRFKEMYGALNGVIVGVAGREQKKHWKFRERMKGKGFRIRFRKYRFKVLLINEFWISFKFLHCQHEDGKCESFRMRLDVNEKKKKIHNIFSKYLMYWLAKSSMYHWAEMYILRLILSNWLDSVWIIKIHPNT